MSTVVMHNVVSVDGFIADADDQVGPLFDWYGNGDVASYYFINDVARAITKAKARRGAHRRRGGGRRRRAGARPRPGR